MIPQPSSFLSPPPNQGKQHKQTKGITALPQTQGKPLDTQRAATIKVSLALMFDIPNHRSVIQAENIWASCPRLRGRHTPFVPWRSRAPKKMLAPVFGFPSPAGRCEPSPASPRRHPTVREALEAAPIPRGSDKSLWEFWQRSSEDELGSAPNGWKHLGGRIWLIRDLWFPPSLCPSMSLALLILPHKVSTKDGLVEPPVTPNPRVANESGGSGKDI